MSAGGVHNRTAAPGAALGAAPGPLDLLDLPDLLDIRQTLLSP